VRSTHIFFPVAFETSGVMNRLAVDLVSEIGRRISSVTEDTRKTMFLFQRLSVALEGEMQSPFKPLLPTQKCDRRCSRTLLINISYLRELSQGRR